MFEFVQAEEGLQKQKANNKKEEAQNKVTCAYLGLMLLEPTRYVPAFDANRKSWRLS